MGYSSAWKHELKRFNAVIAVVKSRGIRPMSKLWDAASALVQYCWEKAKGRRGNNAASRESWKEDVVLADKCGLPKHGELCMAYVQFFILGWCKLNTNVSCFCVLCVYIAFDILRLYIWFKANTNQILGFCSRKTWTVCFL